ncbi:MAG TPA: glycine cleavage system protein GcvH [Anaerohalosphaeraceae bacterium]|nr:glycine cleavage system protein GcvH [Anaerohalosphaeraceae bacterium]HRT49647.1 glycine cleavage system protein GcvH [Anaerohalosphaeraceae bacterium]HRT85964.1 glycine cleavage system protein GcvH [Anaerohalosphaeraceae bacterium]
MSEQELRFTQTHEWARLEGESTVVVGLSSHAIEQLGDVVYMELPSVGAEVSQGQAFGVVESVKAAADIYAPVSGKVTAVNDAVPADPDVLKRDAYGAGWLAKIEVAGLDEYEILMDADAYKKFVETQEE